MESASNALNMLDNLCEEAALQHTEAVDTAATPQKKRKARVSTGEETAPKRSSKRISKKAQKAAEKLAAEQEAAAIAAEKEKADNRAHEIELTRAGRPGTDVVIKDCSFNFFDAEKSSETLRKLISAAAQSTPASQQITTSTPSNEGH